MTAFRPHRSARRVAALVIATLVLLVSALTGTASATTPGRNGRIAFKGYLDAERSTGAIFTVGAHGQQLRQLTEPSPGTVDDQPDWSPDGSLIAFRRCAPDTVCAIYTVRPDGTDLRRLTAPCPDPDAQCVDEAEVAFLPDGRRIVFTRSTGETRTFPGGEEFGEHSDVVVRDLDGRHERVVLRSRPFSGKNVQMVVSPDGRMIAFQRENSPATAPAGGIAVFVIRLDGTHLRRITPWSMRAGDHPDWSPDGRWILFRSPEDDDFLDSQLYVVHPDGSGLRQVTRLPAEQQLLSASFSPDGRRIVYARTGAAGEPDIVTARVDGSHERRLTDRPLWDSAPDWGPRVRTS